MLTDAELDATAQAVFISMATFLGKTDSHRKYPVCWASHDRIAERARMSVSSVQRAVRLLERLGWLVRIGHATVTVTDDKRTRTIKYHIPPLSVTMTDKAGSEGDSVTVTDKGSVTVTDNIKSSSRERPQAAPEEDEDQAAAAAAPSAVAAPGTAAGPSTRPSAGPESSNPTGIVGEVMAARGCTLDAAEKWIERKITGASATVRNETAFLRQCLTNEAESPPASQASARGNGKKPPKGVPTAAQSKGARSRRRQSNHVPAEEVAEAVTASRAGGDHVEIAGRMNVTERAVDCWRQEADRNDAVAAVLGGDTVPRAAKQFGVDVGVLKNFVRSDVLAFLADGGTLERTAERFDLAVETVSAWRKDAVHNEMWRALSAGEPPELVAERFDVDLSTVRDLRDRVVCHAISGGATQKKADRFGVDMKVLLTMRDRAICTALRNNKSPKQVAEDLWVNPETVRSCRIKVALAEVLNGQPPKTVAERFGVDLEDLLHQHRLAIRPEAIKALRERETPEHVANRFHLPVETVVPWQTEAFCDELRTALKMWETPEQTAEQLGMDVERVRAWFHSEEQKQRKLKPAASNGRPHRPW